MRTFHRGFICVSLAVLSTGLTLRAQQAPAPVSEKPTVQQLESEVKSLKDQLATQSILISNLKMQVLQSQAGQVQSEKQKAITDLQASHPGMRWDEQSGNLVPIPPPPPAKSEVPKK